MNPFKELFLLDPQITFLNHGSFGAAPRPVFEAYQTWQRELERQPVEFLGRRATGLLAEARQSLAEFLNVQAQDLVFFPNPTSAVNMVARNLIQPPNTALAAADGDFQLRAGGEVLATDHEYGALNRTWRYLCRVSGASYRTVALPLPLEAPDQVVERFWAQVNERTRVIFISHITSATALTLPVAEICRRARQASLLSIVDGAHAPGQTTLDLEQIGADIYTGACHKWLCAPKGAAFLHVRRAVQPRLDPLIVSWGYESENPSGSQFIDYHEWQGTRDLAAYLSVPAAIEFQRRHNWEQVRADCHALAVETRRRVEALTGLPSVCAAERFQQMFTARLPDRLDLERFKSDLYDRFQVEAPVVAWNDQKFLRVSFQAYNDRAGADRLIEALEALLPR
jgi:isopenicillin-N epimerase